jgi:uncharacterized protein YkwD
MKKHIVILSVLVLLSLSVNCDQTFRCGSQTWEWCDTAEKDEMITRINDARSAAGHGQLSEDTGLMGAAYVHSSDMACNNTVGHDVTEGGMEQRIRGLGAAYDTGLRAWAENVGGRDTADAEGMFNAWMASAGHQANILNGTYTELGVGCVYIDPPSDDAYYWTALFIDR